MQKRIPSEIDFEEKKSRDSKRDEDESVGDLGKNSWGDRTGTSKRKFPWTLIILFQLYTAIPRVGIVTCLTLSPHMLLRGNRWYRRAFGYHLPSTQSLLWYSLRWVSRGSYASKDILSFYFYFVKLQFVLDKPKVSLMKL